MTEGRIHLEIDQQFAIGAHALECQVDLLLTVALVPELGAWVARSTGPIYERLEAAIKLVALCPVSEVRARLLTLWDEINALHGLLLLSVLDLAGHHARTGENILAHHKLPAQSLSSIAEIGALRGVRRWDPRRGIQLGTYCRSWIRKAVMAELGDTFHVAKHERTAHSAEGDPEPDHADPNQTEDALNEQRDREVQSVSLHAALEELRGFDAAAADAVAYRYGMIGSLPAGRRNNGADATRGLEWLKRRMVGGARP